MPDFLVKLQKIRPLYDGVYKFVLLICKLLLIGDILITCYSILGRYIPWIDDPAWSEEVVLTFMCYMAVLSAALAIRRNAHIRMTVFDRYLPVRLIQFLDLFADLCVMGLAFVMLIVGFQYANGIGGKGFYISMPWLSRFWMYFPVPLAGAAMIVFELEAIYLDICAFYTDKPRQTIDTINEALEAAKEVQQQ